MISANWIPELPLSNILIKNGEVICKNLILNLKDVDRFTLRNISINSQSNKINIIDGQNV